MFIVCRKILCCRRMDGVQFQFVYWSRELILFWLLFVLFDESLVRVFESHLSDLVQMCVKNSNLFIFSKELHIKKVIRKFPIDMRLKCESTIHNTKKIHFHWIFQWIEVNNFTCIEFAKAFFFLFTLRTFFSCVITICMRWCSMNRWRKKNENVEYYLSDWICGVIWQKWKPFLMCTLRKDLGNGTKCNL